VLAILGGLRVADENVVNERCAILQRKFPAETGMARRSRELRSFFDKVVLLDFHDAICEPSKIVSWFTNCEYECPSSDTNCSLIHVTLD
jgi:hypothetical protein